MVPSTAPHKLPIIECGHVVDVRDYEGFEIRIQTYKTIEV